ncbi:hypothetical protein INR49_028579 [Caranx melampygus]|nr:hypothetical protein INR49_028579 [Caranx melampygus]
MHKSPKLQPVVARAYRAALEPSSRIDYEVYYYKRVHFNLDAEKASLSDVPRLHARFYSTWSTAGLTSWCSRFDSMRIHMGTSQVQVACEIQVSADTEKSININHWEIMRRFREMQLERAQRTKDGRYHPRGMDDPQRGTKEMRSGGRGDGKDKRT